MDFGLNGEHFSQGDQRHHDESHGRIYRRCSGSIVDDPLRNALLDSSQKRAKPSCSVRQILGYFCS